MTKIKQLFILTFSISFLLTTYSINGQAKKIDKIELIQNFQLGTKYQYEVQRGKIDSRQPGSENIKNSTEVEFRVLSEDKDFKECSWKYGPSKVIGVNPNQVNELSRKLMNIYHGIEVKFIINNKGAIQEITNFEECKIYIKNAFKFIYENAPNKITPEENEKMDEVLKASYRTPGILLSTYCPELTIFFAMFGEIIKPDSVYISKSEMPNAFGGRNFPADVSTKIDNIKDNIAYISIKKTIPSDELKAIMKETFIELSKTSQKPFKENEISKMNMSSYLTYNYDFQKKSLTEVYLKKSVEVDGVKQTHTLKVILKN